MRFSQSSRLLVVGALRVAATDANQQIPIITDSATQGCAAAVRIFGLHPQHSLSNHMSISVLRSGGSLPIKFTDAKHNIF